MVRLFVVGMVLLALAEAVAALFFCIGFFWAGGVIPGIMLAIGAVVLLLIFWAGDVVITFDSLPKEATLKVSWWLRAQVFLGGDPMLKVRFLGLPYRRSLKPKKKPEKPEPKIDMKRWALRNLSDLLRLALAGAQGANEMYWQTRALTVTVNAPAETDVVDQIVAGLVGHRLLSRLDIKVLPEGPRRVQFLYRVPLLTAASTGLFVLLQGRVLGLVRSLAKARKQAKALPRVP